MATPGTTARRRRPTRGQLTQHPVLILVVSLMALIAVGTGLLATDLATRGTHPAPLSVALFTSASSVCVTGLTVVDTTTYWSGFGHAVILVLAECGALAVMAAASLLALIVTGRLGLRSRLLAQSELNGVNRNTVKRVLVGTVLAAVSIEAVVAVVLALRLYFGYGESFSRSLWLGVFHSVSAFTNAGFSLWPRSLGAFAGDPYVLVPVLLAMIAGGLGLPVLLELARRRSPHAWSLHTRLTLLGTGVLLVAGPVLVTITEWHNARTIGTLPWGHRLAAGAFAGISPRSAGFQTFDYSHAAPSTLVTTEVLSIIGGGSAGTAGGMKVTTVAILALAVAAEVRGHRDVDVMHRRIAESTIRQAIAVAALTFLVVTTATLVLLELTHWDLDNVLFETVSAVSSSGLSTGVTATLDGAAQGVIILLMFLGRVGPIGAATALALHRDRRSFRYPESRPIIG